MTESSDTKNNMNEHCCIWCGTHFQQATSQRSPVCPRCYRLLISAGLKDEEIFAVGKPEQNEIDD